jgi:hypothetical protein
MSLDTSLRLPPDLKRSRLGRLLIPFALVAAAALLATGLRAGTGAFEAWQNQRAAAAADRAAHMAMPTNPEIEQQWGIRVTLVQLLASGGLVEVRYEVLNTDRANRLHADTSLDTIPSILLEGSSNQIKPRSLMFHYHHGDKGTEGRTYSIVYGNSGSILHRGSLVTVRMADGLLLQHVPVLG